MYFLGLFIYFVDERLYSCSWILQVQLSVLFLPFHEIAVYKWKLLWRHQIPDS
jgi:hypothetical protein